MKHLFAIPVMALFTACASTPSSPTAEAEVLPPTDIPVVVKKRSAQYVGMLEHPVRYALINSLKGGLNLQERDIKLASFIREDNTWFTVDCKEIDANLSLGVVKLTLPHISFKEKSSIHTQQQQFIKAAKELECPRLDI